MAIRALIYFVFILSFAANSAGQNPDVRVEPGSNSALLFKAVPKAAVRSELSGRATVTVSIDERGNVDKVLSIAGPGWVCPDVNRQDVVALRKAAATAAAAVKFEPEIKDGLAVPSNVDVVFDFREGSRTIKMAGIRRHRPAVAATTKISEPVSVTVNVTVETDGSVFEAEPVNGPESFRNASRLAACGTKFAPTIISGEPFRVQGTMIYRFTPPANIRRNVQ